jgi:hypothetical protein
MLDTNKNFCSSPWIYYAFRRDPLIVILVLEMSNGTPLKDSNNLTLPLILQ